MAVKDWLVRQLGGQPAQESNFTDMVQAQLYARAMGESEKLGDHDAQALGRLAARSKVVAEGPSAAIIEKRLTYGSDQWTQAGATVLSQAVYDLHRHGRCLFFLEGEQGLACWPAQHWGIDNHGASPEITLTLSSPQPEGKDPKKSRHRLPAPYLALVKLPDRSGQGLELAAAERALQDVVERASLETLIGPPLLEGQPGELGSADEMRRLLEEGRKRGQPLRQLVVDDSAQMQSGSVPSHVAPMTTAAMEAIDSRSGVPLLGLSRGQLAARLVVDDVLRRYLDLIQASLSRLAGGTIRLLLPASDLERRARAVTRLLESETDVITRDEAREMLGLLPS